MKIISSNKDLSSFLHKLIIKYDELSFAVAWATPNNAVFKSLLNRQDIIKKSVIGTHFYQTHPDVLDSFYSNKNVRFVMQPDGVFHPKVFLFGDERRWEALIGSANLTTGALTRNSELMVLIQGGGTVNLKVYREIEAALKQYWAMGERLNKEQIASYRKVWSFKKPAVNRLQGRYGASKVGKNDIDSRIKTMDWAEFSAAVLAEGQDRFAGRRELLSNIRLSFVQYKTFGAMPLRQRYEVSGMPLNDMMLNGWFGSMKGAGNFNNKVKNNDLNLSRALDEIPMEGVVTRAQFDSYVKYFMASLGGGRQGLATLTRLLAMKRPDQFLCVDGQNKKNILLDLNVKQHAFDHGRYWEEVVEQVRETLWWNSPRPEDYDEQSIWDGRVAFLDALFYEESQ